MFKFNLDQVVFYLRSNQVYSAPIISRRYIDNKWEDKPAFQKFGPGGVRYATVHGEYEESKLFASREDLAASLLKS